MRLRSLRVAEYGPLSGLDHEFDDGLEVWYGPNESGKTLTLEALLRLCSPAVVDVVPGVGRVSAPPVGQVAIEVGGERHVLGEETRLADLVEITPRQLRNVFVVRDGDLRLGEEHDFYDATARRLADLHTAELDALRDRLVDLGRLTPTALDLSTAAEHDEAREVRTEAADLADRIRSYVTECREIGMAAAERERVAVATDLDRARTDLQRQRLAERTATHERLQDHLETVERATDRLADRECTPEDLDRLERIDADLDRLADRLERLDERRSELTEERFDLEERRAALEGEVAAATDREAAVEEAERALERYREAAAGEIDGAVTDGRQPILVVAIAVAAFLAAGATAIAGSVGLAAAMAAVGTIAAGWAVWRLRRARAAARSRADILATARDAGLDVDSIADVAPAIAEWREEVRALEDRLDGVENDLAVRDQRLEDLESERREANERRRDLRRERRELLAAGGVPDVAAYREAVEVAESLRAERRSATASLAERLGDRSDAAMPERIEHWETQLDEMAEAITDEGGADVSAEAFDPDRRDRLAERVADLEERRATLAERLDEHEDAIDEFARDLGSIPTGRFRESPIALDARSVEGLAAVAADLEHLVADLERDADVSRVAIDALEAVETEEEQKLATLFGRESGASRAFRTITDGRYDAVTYDAAEQTLRVHRSGEDRTLPPQALSRGTADQLYLAARLGLGEALLAGEPGFLLLDDPLLPADDGRLRAGFDALERLAAAGWQVVYWTAKSEVGEDVAGRRDIPCRRLERLD